MRSRVLIVGAGPAGIEMAAALLAIPISFDITIAEKGATIGAGILDNWSKVKLFSTWSLNTSTHGLAALDNSFPQDVCPTGEQYVAQYLKPLADALSSKHPKNLTLKFNTCIVSIGRTTALKKTMGSSTRSSSPFQALSQDSNTNVENYGTYDIVVDCSGCFEKRVHFGRGGIPALGERYLSADILTHKIATDDEGGGTIAVFGSGYSAATSVKNLLENDNVKQIYWLTRKPANNNDATLYEIIDNDPLPSRKALCELGNNLSSQTNSRCTMIGNVAATKCEIIEGRCRITLEPLNSANNKNSNPPQFIYADKIHNNCGLRPDTSIHSELQVHYCYASDGPMKLAATLGGGGDCLAQTSKGVESLLNPEPNFFIVGIKSYGRNSTFLLKMGIAQAAEIADHLLKI